MNRIKISRQDRIADKVLAFQMWVKRWSDMALIGIDDRAKEALMMIRKISRECEDMDET